MSARLVHFTSEIRRNGFLKSRASQGASLDERAKEVHIPGIHNHLIQTDCEQGLVWLGLVWFGLVWFGLVWFGLVWFGLVWFGLVWFRSVWLGWVGLGWVGLGWVGLGWVGFFVGLGFLLGWVFCWAGLFRRVGLFGWIGLLDWVASLGFESLDKRPQDTHVPRLHHPTIKRFGLCSPEGGYYFYIPQSTSCGRSKKLLGLFGKGLVWLIRVIS